ncbi:hypothetical protein [Curtobacterium sp. PhB130]|uniref:hypothetical protein n=1 Tax=Curtobacterium sp. PhB130 TaxID=2485178 RepID=UPI000F4B6DBC|nr:hypothetical protein [Curtobacterium sp. PhB130]
MFDAVGAARVLDRVATLVAAGVPPPRAWVLVGAGAGAGAGVVAGVGAAAGAAAAGPGSGAGDPARADVRAVLAVAARTGAPIAPTLRALAAALRRAAAGERAVRVALAGPRTSANVVLALPLLGLVLGALWGIDTASVLLGSPVGWACLLTGAALVAVGRVWSARLVRAAEPDGRIPGVVLDAWAVALSGGGAWSGARSAVEDAFGDRPLGAAERHRLAETLGLARRAGVPAAALLRAAAEDLRDDDAADALAAAERLGVRLVVPLGVCVLPAFVLVGVVPVVIGILSSTVVGFG